MKKLIAAIAMASAVSGVAEARNDKLSFPIAGALKHEKAGGVLMQDIGLYFGSQATPPLVDPNSKLEMTVDRKTNAFGKSDEAACQWAMLSALKALQERALKEGANAVVNIRSYLDDTEYSSETEFQCAAGAVRSGVVLKGRIAKVQK
jgi:hypothetical protein